MGGGVSQLTPEQIQQLTQRTPFDEKDLSRLLKHYARYDSSETGMEGIPYETVLTIPELYSHPMVPRLLELFIDKQTQRLNAERFIYFCAALSSKMAVDKKRKIAWRCFDVNNTGRIEYAELFHFFKSLFDCSLDDDHIMHCIFKTLDRQHSTSQTIADNGTSMAITLQDFDKFVSDADIQARFTIDLQQPASKTS